MGGGEAWEDRRGFPLEVVCEHTFDLMKEAHLLGRSDAVAYVFKPLTTTRMYIHDCTEAQYLRKGKGFYGTF